MLARACVFIAASCVIVAPQARQDAGTIELERMVAAERAFAAATREIGIRDGFLTFFADDAIDIVPAGGGLRLIVAKERLREQPRAPVPPSTMLEWSPRWGAISSAGDLGWLTGPFVRTGGGQPVGHGAYFSVWKRQPDRTFKVWLDQGVTTSRPVSSFAETFTAGPMPQAADPVTSVSGTEGLARLFEARFASAASKDIGAAYREFAHPQVRIHRNERAPMVGREDSAAMMEGTFSRMTWAVLRVETSESGDLAVTVGSYDAAARPYEGRPGTPERGFFTRVWHREPGNIWRIVFETNGIR